MFLRAQGGKRAVESAWGRTQAARIKELVTKRVEAQRLAQEAEDESARWRNRCASLCREKHALQEALEKEKNMRLCVICKDAEATHIMLPCAHLCTCADCAGRLRATRLTCPMCRSVVAQVKKVFQG